MTNLPKRVFTSFFLLIIVVICLFFHKYLWLFLIILSSTIAFFEFKELTKKIWKKGKSSFYVANIVSFFYLILFTYSAYELYMIGVYLTFLILLFCIFSDIGGYVIGKTVGGKKLTKISPNKTISGSIGSLIFSLIPILLFMLIFDFTKNENFKFFGQAISDIIFLCLLSSLMCQLGDLFISYFKRKAKIKDTGSILPGHGGLLDRIDGILFTIPFIFIIYKLFF